MDIHIEGNYICANSKHIAVPWRGGATGSVIIAGAECLCKFSAHTPPCIQGHSDQILDLSFSPFHEDLLMTASADSTIKLWQIPSEGLSENLEKNTEF